jgi:hypothetical protein
MMTFFMLGGTLTLSFERRKQQPCSCHAALASVNSAV